MTLIAAFVVLFTSLSATVDSNRTAYFGKEAPAVVYDRNGAAESLQSMRGKWVVLSFWASTDLESRLLQNRIASIMKAAHDNDASGNDAKIEFQTPARVYTLSPRENVEVISVNFDSTPGMMQEIVKLDNLLEGTQCRVGSVNEISRLCESFRMDNGLRSFIIDPEGRLAVADPDEATLRLLLSRS